MSQTLHNHIFKLFIRDGAIQSLAIVSRLQKISLKYRLLCSSRVISHHFSGCIPKRSVIAENRSSSAAKASTKMVVGDVRRNITQSNSRTSHNDLIQRDGLWGWAVTFASFMTIALTFGIVYSAGLFLSELVRISGEPVAKVAWIFSIMNGLQMLVGK